MSTTVNKSKVKESRIVFQLNIDKSEGIITSNGWEFPKQTKAIKGIQLSSDYPNKLYHRGSQRIEIGGDEIFPDQFQSSLLMSSLAVAPKERFFDLGEVAPNDLSVKIRYQDENHSQAVFNGGYKLIVTFLIDESV
ncbi:hypothetical protein [Aquimarina agarilytica]|uniref:hypothetical protein n=1 Tax=Aquimarina agarilytica TaxID=1087449 RepID=UPI000287CFF0|nr:hypothetical protein [Aquimarina agarilytica]